MHCLLCHSIYDSILVSFTITTMVLTGLVLHINAVRRLFQCRFEEEAIPMSSTVSVLFVITLKFYL